MPILITRMGKVFETDYAAPLSIYGGVIFTTKVLESSVEEVNKIFGDSKQTEELTVMNGDHVVGVYTGYTRYCGFRLQNDGSIIVTLQKSLEA